MVIMKKPLTKKGQKEKSVSKPAKKHISTSLRFPIVGIGGSTDRLEALKDFCKNIPD